MPLPRIHRAARAVLAIAVAGLLLLGAVAPGLVSVAAAADDKPVMTARGSPSPWTSRTPAPR